MDEPQRVLVFAPGFPPAEEGGGPIQTLRALVAAAPPRFDVRVVTRSREYRSGRALEVAPGRWSEREGRPCLYLPTGTRAGRRRLVAEARALRPQLLYFNSFFDPELSLWPQLALRRMPGTRLVAPRGEFGAAALARRSAKKRVTLAAYRALGLHRRVIWHASAPEEAEDIRRLWGAGARVVVRENETALPAGARPPGAAHAGALRCVFLARLTPMKGLHVAIGALAALPEGSRVHLDVYGTEEEPDYLALCRAAAERLPPGVSVAFHGPIPHESVAEAFAAHDLALVPTAGENFGHVIAESLAASCPALVTDATPWGAVLRDGGGAEVAGRDPGRWAERIAEHAALDAESRRALRLAAGAAYERWRALPKGRHVFELAAEAARCATPSRGSAMVEP